jgi:hypothetical protein
MHPRGTLPERELIVETAHILEGRMQGKYEPGAPGGQSPVANGNDLMVLRDSLSIRGEHR